MTPRDIRRWLVRMVLLLGGAALLLAARTPGHHRLLELLVGGGCVLGVLIDGAIDLVLAFAAKTVKPRRFENE